MARRDRERRWTVEGSAERLDIGALRRAGRVSLGRDYVLVAFEGRQQKVRIAASRRVLGRNPISYQLYFWCACGRRCCVLFPSFRGWGCRKCAGLTYECRTLYKRTRWRRRLLKMQEQLGLRADVVLERLERPKGMRRDKFALREANWWRTWAKVKVGMSEKQFQRNVATGRGRSY
jgi:hypothetical protein